MEDLLHINEVAKLVGKSAVTLIQWDKWSDEEEEAGRPRIIPKSVNKGSGRGNGRYWTPAEANQIKETAANLKQGDLARFTRRKYGKYYEGRR